MKVHLANNSTWSDGNEYIMGTASEVHTNALFDIYPNDTTITAEFKGNTQQSGTPSPSAPVSVVGVGYLDGAAYKIPVEIGLSTQSIDLSAVSTFRMIKRRVFTGTEEWSKGNYAPSGGYQFFTPKPSDMAENPDWILTHFKKGTGLNGSAVSVYLSLYPETSILPENASINDFKAWLASQYAANTPVTIYYVLVEPVTDTLNEPLQKIGDYSDSISNITLTTTAGEKSFGVNTAVKPSEITLNFRGWHPKDPKESTGGEWS